MKKIRFGKMVLMVTGLVLVTNYNNCGKVAFSPVTNAQLGQNNPDGTLSVPTGPTPPPVCQPFSNGTSNVSSTNGIKASLTYIPNTSPIVANSGQNLTVSSFQPGQTDVVSIPNSVFLNQFAIFTQDFSLGFNTANGFLNDTNGNKLVEYFALHAAGNIMLNPGDTADNYQFAVISDDGSITSFSNPNSGTPDAIISNDHTHANKMVCAANSIALQNGKPENYQLDYFQGPRVRISLVMLWRHGSSLSINEPNCDVAEDDQFYFSPDPTTDQPMPTNNWNTMLSQRGWQVVPTANFYLPGGTSNPCAGN